MKRVWEILVLAMIFGLVASGIGFAETATQPDKTAQAQEATQPQAQPQEATQPQAQLKTGDSIELTGTVLSDNTFVDENGESYQLSNSEKSKDLQEYVGKKVKVKATVMDSEAGEKNISITSYELIPE